MANSNKICSFAGHFVPEGWVSCDGKNGHPNLPPFQKVSDWDQIRYMCATPDNTNDDTFIGQIIPFAGKFAPSDWAFCDGKKMDVGPNTVLFSILGTRFGGNGMDTFCLPKLTDLLNEGEKKTGIRYIICINGIYPSRP